MKMTKIEFWRNLLEVCSKSDKKESKHQCYAFISGACDCRDDRVPRINDMMCELATNTDHRSKAEVIKYAEKQINRHEHKCKKKDHIRDTTKKVEEPKPVEEPTPLEIAKMIRDNGYKCAVNLGVETYTCEQCPLDVTKIPQLCGSGFKEDTRDYAMRIKLIDDYISANEPKPEPIITFGKMTEMETAKAVVKIDGDCLAYESTFCSQCWMKEKCSKVLPNKAQRVIDAESYIKANEPTVKENLSVPQPIKFDDPVPEYVYYFNGISTMERIAVASLSAYKRPDSFVSFAVDVIGRQYLLTDCYRTPEEALQVAKKLWNGENE